MKGKMRGRGFENKCSGRARMTWSRGNEGVNEAFLGIAVSECAGCLHCPGSQGFGCSSIEFS